ncbi:MAG: response regulator [Proteobacteria bacterium]|nr:MAG: response regulator [Pseudomonadota bacterium]
MAVLKKLGVNAELAKDGQEAVELASQNNYNLILMDCQMPVVDGFEATRRIRSMKCGPFLPVRIVALTANAMSGDRERCLAAGMDDYISKPFKADDIRRILNDISKID